MGLCTEIQKCPKLLKVYTEGKSQKFLEISKCGPQNENKTQFRVCCGTKDDYVGMYLIFINFLALGREISNLKNTHPCLF